MIRGYATWSRRGPLGSRELVIRDDNGDDQVFAFETFFNGHGALTLAVFSHSRPAMITVGRRAARLTLVSMLTPGDLDLRQ
jgi:hypothetical protein